MSDTEFDNPEVLKVVNLLPNLRLNLWVPRGLTLGSGWVLL